MAGNTVTDYSYNKIGFGIDDGTILAESGGKLGIFGTTPVAQQAGGSTAPTTTISAVTTASVTTASTTTTPAGYATTTQADQIAADVESLITAVNIIKGRVDDITTSYNTTLASLKTTGYIS